MRYVPDYVNFLVIGGIFLGSAGFLHLFRQIDEELQQCSIKDMKTKWLFCVSFVSVGMLLLLYSTGKGIISIVLLGVYLVVCMVTDVMICQVYDVMQYLGVLGGGIWLFIQNPEKSIGFSIIIFALMQYFILIHMYGKADGMGYSICSLYLAGRGMDIEGYLYHMGISFSVLAIAQSIRGNVTSKGNLRKAVALYPYITVGFLLMWIFLL
ncbi:MAG: hypothetical protein IKK33_04385 [Lachnospiraceae bacterium]|nr:hypothetical protein [Lachnospiraceae bacterium]